MALETEIKFCVQDFEALRKSLTAHGAELVSRRFESNAVYDDPGRSLKARGILLRLRSDGRDLLTLKRPPDAPAGSTSFKHQEEFETGVTDPAAVRAMLDALGYAPAFAYEKLRETWSMGAVLVCLDTLPFGKFVEMEGEESALRAVAETLGLDIAQGSAETYYALNLRLGTEKGSRTDESFTFLAAERERILNELRREDSPTSD